MTTTERETKDEAGPETLVERIAEDEPVRAPSLQAEPETHRGRFRVVYLVLGLILVLAAGALVYLVSQPGTEPRGPFSPWEPGPIGRSRWANRRRSANVWHTD